MAVSFKSLYAGRTLYEVIKRKMGNTKSLTTDIVIVKVHQIDRENNKALISWGNSNEMKWKNESWFKRSTLRAKKPELRESFTGVKYLAR